MKKDRYDFRINSDVLAQLRERYQTTSSTLAVHKAIDEAILKCVTFQKKHRIWTAKQTLAYVSNEDVIKDARLSYRESRDKIEVLRAFYNASTASDAIRCAIWDIINENYCNEPMKFHENLFYMTGQKNAEMLDFLNEVFEDVKKNYHVTGYCEPFVGTANVLLHTATTHIESINDNSEFLINLLRVIQKYPVDFKLRLLQFDLTRKSFNECKHSLKPYLDTSLPTSQKFRFKNLSTQEQIEIAVCFYITRYASAYGKGESYKSNISSTGLHRKLDTIYPLSLRLQGVSIKKRDAVYWCKGLKNASNFLIYIDAPYIFSEEHYAVNNQKKRIFHMHRALRNRIEELRQKNICFISYRVTASQSMKQHGINSEDICTVLDRLYMNQHFFVRFRTLKRTHNQTEVLIGTVEFCGSSPYIYPIHEMEVQHND